MGQKINPIGFRIGAYANPKSIWYTDKHRYAAKLQEDLFIRKYLLRQLSYAAVSQIDIKRCAELVSISIYSARPGVIIGKKGADIEKLKSSLLSIVSSVVDIDIVEIRKPEVNAVLIAATIAQQLERRMSFRRVMKKALQSAMRYGAKGVKISCAGRLSGAEIARTEWYKEGQVPLHKLKANMEFASKGALTLYGLIGVKVWIYKGDFSR